MKNRKNNRKDLLSLKFISLFIFFIFLSLSVYAQPDDTKCLVCHGKKGFSNPLSTGRILNLYVDAKELRKSVHSEKSCTDCHSDVLSIPHRNEINKVNCAERCHFVGNPSGAPETVKYSEYFQSVHGQALLKGVSSAPICQDCHGSHDIYKPDNENSKVSRKNIPKTCGKCHLQEYVDFTNSVHGEAYQKGNPDVPVCTNCHGEHKILSHDNPKSTVYASHIRETCSACHEKMQIMEKYGVSTEQVETYEESFHGIANEFGIKTAANCASCHGYHNIRPSSDPKSTIYKDNIPKTCGKCHPGANINFAKGKMHINPKKKESGIVYYVAQSFKYLTISVMLALVAHIILDLRKRLKKTES
ncbi:MAG: hypothetical protein D6734_10695 [Candidatus Schekmanbacteria bacterium]|nr:MAG: hypothetical protein D6734_10695 [Candidatus Schekmanbacteria bacterium]